MTNKTKLRKKLLFVAIVILVLIIIGICCVMGIDIYVKSFAKGKLYYQAENVPNKKIAVVLGTTKYTHGRKNLFYEYRLNAAVDLWKAGKINAILVSGDNSRIGYDEPSNMKEDLISRGVPAEFITVDFAGFRTLDSVVRAKEIFDLDDYIVVSQEFHCERAIYLAEKKGQKIIGYCAKDVSDPAGIKSILREYLAKPKALLDIIFGKKPKFLGQKENINYRVDL